MTSGTTCWRTTIKTVVNQRNTVDCKHSYEHVFPRCSQKRQLALHKVRRADFDTRLPFCNEKRNARGIHVDDDFSEKKKKIVKAFDLYRDDGSLPRCPCTTTRSRLWRGVNDVFNLLEPRARLFIIYTRARGRVYHSRPLCDHTRPICQYTHARVRKYKKVCI